MLILLFLPSGLGYVHTRNVAAISTPQDLPLASLAHLINPSNNWTAATDCYRSRQGAVPYDVASDTLYLPTYLS